MQSKGSKKRKKLPARLEAMREEPPDIPDSLLQMLVRSFPDMKQERLQWLGSRLQDAARNAINLLLLPREPDTILRVSAIESFALALAEKWAHLLPEDIEQFAAEIRPSDVTTDIRDDDR